MIFLILSWFVFVIFSLWLLKYNKIYKFNNPLILLLSIITIFGLGKIIYLYYFAKSYYIYFNLTDYNFEKLYYGTLITYLFVFSVFLGFFYTKKFKNKNINKVIIYKGDGIIGLSISLIILSISLFSLYLFIQSGGGLIVLSAKRFLANGADPSSRLDNFNYILFKLTQLSELSFYISYFYLLLGKIKYKKIWFLISIFSFIIIVLNSIIFSNRAAIIILLIDMYLLYIIVKKNISKKMIFSIVIIFFTLFMIMSILRSGDASSEKTFLDHIFAGRYFADIAKLSVILEAIDNSITPKLDYTTIGSFISSYMNIGRYVGVNIFGTVSSGVPMGIIAELYWIGGFIAIILGGFILGYIYRYIYHYILKKNNNMFLLLGIIFIYSRSVVFLLNNGLGVTIYQIVLDIIPLALFALINIHTKRKYINV